jgi:hypothetical protein
VAVPDRNEVLLEQEVWEANVVAARLVALAVALALLLPLAWFVWPHWAGGGLG